ncbi:MAG: porin family protein [Burkholderiales bacterium]|jgi:hypothetical protein|uniref:outer membrane beta-barrel protein n=1 Tax=Limnobacter sp. TaxID=2003368 RepID=UPI0039BCB6C1|nr:porin family protein [Burkholderiales bacterium]
MPNTTFVTTLLALVLASASNAAAAHGNHTTSQAKPSPFIGITQTSLKIKLDTLPNATWKADAIGVNAGLPLTNNIWLEAKGLKGTNSTSINNTRRELDHYIGLNLVGRLPIISTGFSLYGSVGAGQTKLSTTGPGIQTSESNSSLGYGFGVMYNTGPFNFRVGYESLFNDDGIEIDGMNVSGGYRF